MFLLLLFVISYPGLLIRCTDAFSHSVVTTAAVGSSASASVSLLLLSSPLLIRNERSQSQHQNHHQHQHRPRIIITTTTTTTTMTTLMMTRHDHDTDADTYTDADADADADADTTTPNIITPIVGTSNDGNIDTYTDASTTVITPSTTTSGGSGSSCSGINNWIEAATRSRSLYIPNPNTTNSTDTNSNKNIRRRRIIEVRPSQVLATSVGQFDNDNDNDNDNNKKQNNSENSNITAISTITTTTIDCTSSPDNSTIVDAGNGLFVTENISQNELLFSLSVSRCVITVENSFVVDNIDNDNDADSLMEAFEGLTRIGLDTVALAGYLANQYVCDTILQQQQQQQSMKLTNNDDDVDDESRNNNTSKIETREKANEKEEGTAVSSSVSEFTLYIRSLPWTQVNQDHILWWSSYDNEDEDEVENEDDETDDESTNKEQEELLVSLLQGSVIEEEVNGILLDVNGATQLLIEILEPTILQKYNVAFGVEDDADVPVDEINQNNVSDSDNNNGRSRSRRACKMLLSKAIRGAFVILMSRSFDESFLGGAIINKDVYYENDNGSDNDNDDNDTNEEESSSPLDRNKYKNKEKKDFGERLVPLFDTMQHVPTGQQPNVYHMFEDDDDEYDDDDDEFDDDDNMDGNGNRNKYGTGRINVYARRDLKEGEELYISYHDTLEPYAFGIRFGFVPGESKDIQTLLKERNPIFFPK